MADLEAKLKEAAGARFRMIATDGVFSMDGYIANLPAICDLAEQIRRAGDGGRFARRRVSWASTAAARHEHHGVMGRVDIITGTLGKALGGASGGYTSGRKEIIELLRQRSRPYLFSNTLAPAIAGASLKVLELLAASTELRDKLEANTKFFREGMAGLGFTILPGTHPIVPIMLGDAALAAQIRRRHAGARASM